MARMAGREAEREILGHQGDEAHYLHDEVQIAWMLDDAEPWADPQSFKTRLRAKTRMLVRRHRKSIEWVARALLSRGTLAPEDVEALIAAAAARRPALAWWDSALRARAVIHRDAAGHPPSA
jgi:hypothetical protein